jgi:hypothetical protein
MFVGYNTRRDVCRAVLFGRHLRRGYFPVVRTPGVRFRLDAGLFNGRRIGLLGSLPDLRRGGCGWRWLRGWQGLFRADKVHRHRPVMDKSFRDRAEDNQASKK